MNPAFNSTADFRIRPGYRRIIIKNKPIMTVSWPEPNAKGELNVTRMSVVLEEKVSSTHLVLNKSSGKKGTSSRITSWKISRKEWTQLVVVAEVGNTSSVTIWHRNDLSAFKTFRRLKNCFNYHQPKYEVFL